MRAAILLGLPILSGCSVLDQGPMSRPAMLDPTKIYLENFDQVNVRKHQIDDYACIRGMLICESHSGPDYDCRCEEFDGW